MPLLPLTPDMLNRIKNSITANASAFQTDTIEIDQIGTSPGGRRLVEAFSWPIAEALNYFRDEGAISTVTPDNPRMGIKGSFRILNLSYFNIDFGSLEIPVRFSIDNRIASDLQIMTELYAEIYDVENRLRFILEKKLSEQYGDRFESHLPRTVKESIEREKAMTQWYIDDNRTKILHYAQFSHLSRLLQMQDLLLDATVVAGLVDRLGYLNEVRTRVAHNNIIPNNEIQMTKEKCEQCRRLVSQIQS